MEVLWSDRLMLPSLMFGKFHGINLEFKHTWQMLDLAPAVHRFWEQQCYTFQCFAICCYSISCLSWDGSHKKNILTFAKWIYCLLVWQWFKDVQRYATHANEIKTDQMSRKTNDKESFFCAGKRMFLARCFLHDPRPNILCAGASERIWWRPTCEVVEHLRAKGKDKETGLSRLKRTWTK